MSCVLILCCGFSCAKPVFLAWGQELSWAPKENSTQHPATATTCGQFLAKISLWGQVCSIKKFVKEEAEASFGSDQCGSRYHSWGQACGVLYGLLPLVHVGITASSCFVWPCLASWLLQSFSSALLIPPSPFSPRQLYYCLPFSLSPGSI